MSWVERAATEVRRPTAVAKFQRRGMAKDVELVVTRRDGDGDDDDDDDDDRLSVYTPSRSNLEAQEPCYRVFTDMSLLVAGIERMSEQNAGRCERKRNKRENRPIRNETPED